ncbi:hypothetical protein CVT24_007777 [Panaeolus cyanescens]|uniref:Uncharacterized protein n=1 Tax=Panaeolus cyanescens TaxID=181874 RepID=A0A409YKR5_9AGAR|nr:hypothetical protein CVT24_007777 [Panaeolus cyanescens]
MKVTNVLQILKQVVMPIFTKERDISARAFAMERIHRHYVIKGLEGRGVELANVRPTPWHGEGGKSNNHRTGHLTVDFLDALGNHITTQHVYKDYDAPPATLIKNEFNCPRALKLEK